MPVGPLHLDVPRFLEVERLWLANCTLDGLFPASEAKIQLALGDQMLKSQVERHGDRITATANSTARAEQNGTQEIVCKVTLGDESRETRRNLTIYSKRGWGASGPRGGALATEWEELRCGRGLGNQGSTIA